VCSDHVPHSTAQLLQSQKTLHLSGVGRVRTTPTLAKWPLPGNAQRLSKQEPRAQRRVYFIWPLNIMAA
jgi:hypothetical protein